jgi:hypothetical protein
MAVLGLNNIVSNPQVDEEELRSSIEEAKDFRRLSRVLSKNGFGMKSGGKHIHFIALSTGKQFPVPTHSGRIDRGTLRSIANQAIDALRNRQQ